jgi:LmbE family N-acetylglucosaminyl deacetylase
MSDNLRILAIGAHPDDCEILVGGMAALWSAGGHLVRFVSATNGETGHHVQGGAALVRRRVAEAAAAAATLGVQSQVLPIPNGQIEPTLHYRRMFIRLIREFDPDLVLTHRPNDYHPDHRYTSILVQDSAYMVGVPFFTEVPPLKRNPVFLYTSDRFKRPNPFTADVAVSIDEVMEPTLDALLVMESQIHEGGADGNASLYPSDEAARQRRREVVRKNLARRYAGAADNYRETLIKFYGEEQGKKVRYAQAFEICEYGRQPSAAEIKQLFPF